LNWVDYLLGHTPRGADAQAYSRPTPEQLKEVYVKAMPELEISGESREASINEQMEEDRRKISELEEKIASLEASGEYLLRHGGGKQLLEENPSAEEMVREMRELKRKKRLAGGQGDCGREEGCPVQKVIPEGDVEKALSEGWRFVSNLNGGKVVIER